VVHKQFTLSEFQQSPVFRILTKHYYNVNTEIKYDQKYITKATTTKFQGLIIDNTLSW